MHLFLDWIIDQLNCFLLGSVSGCIMFLVRKNKIAGYGNTWSSFTQERWEKRTNTCIWSDKGMVVLLIVPVETLPPLFCATCFRSASGFLNSSSKFYFMSWFFWLVACSPTSFLDRDGVKHINYDIIMGSFLIYLSLSRIRQRIYLELLINHYPFFF